MRAAAVARVADTAPRTAPAVTAAVTGAPKPPPTADLPIRPSRPTPPPAPNRAPRERRYRGGAPFVTSVIIHGALLAAIIAVTASRTPPMAITGTVISVSLIGEASSSGAADATDGGATDGGSDPIEDSPDDAQSAMAAPDSPLRSERPTETPTETPVDAPMETPVAPAEAPAVTEAPAEPPPTATPPEEGTRDEPGEEAPLPPPPPPDAPVAAPPPPPPPKPAIVPATATPPAAAPSPPVVKRKTAPRTAAGNGDGAEGVGGRSGGSGGAVAKGPATGAESARAIHQPRPRYPLSARRRGLEGLVVLRVTVAADGLVERVEVAVGSGVAALDAAARSAVEGWRFEPARRAGIPTRETVDVPVRFKLDEG